MKSEIGNNIYCNSIVATLPLNTIAIPLTTHHTIYSIAIVLQYNILFPIYA